MDLLLAGGYFRARINGLSRFDKVIGGLSWCITSSNEDLDIDIFFQEEASMGQRIKLGEGIVRALKRMRCPFPLESFQIEGGANTSDFVNIFPVVQWLVKKVIETREETGDLMRQYSESLFTKCFALPGENERKAKAEQAREFRKTLVERYKPRRQFVKPGRRVPYLNPRGEEENVVTTLLEYGEYHRSVNVKTKGEAQPLGGVLSGKEKDKDFNSSDEERRKALKGLNQIGSSDRAGMAKVGDLLSGGDFRDRFDGTDGRGENSEESLKLRAARNHEQRISKLERDLTTQAQAAEAMKTQFAQLQERCHNLQNEFIARQAYNKKIVEEIGKLDALETPENARQLQMLRALVALNENLRNQESKFKLECKNKRISWLAKIEKLKAELPESGRSREEEEILTAYDKDVERMAAMKSALAKRARLIVLVERKIDEIPSRIELQQYQRQFVELVDQVGNKFVETRRYFNAYNTLESTKSFLQKEVSILNSIYDNYKTAMNSRSSRDVFMNSLAEILKSVTQSLEKAETKLNNEKDSKTKISDKFSALVDRERTFYKLTKEFQEECKKNETLQSKIVKE